MELATITSKGQVTIPIALRKKHGLKEGGKVLFLEDGDRVYMINATMAALVEAQAAFAGAAKELGLESEEDVIEMMRRFRQERMTK